MSEILTSPIPAVLPPPPYEQVKSDITQPNEKSRFSWDDFKREDWFPDYYNEKDNRLSAWLGFGRDLRLSFASLYKEPIDLDEDDMIESHPADEMVVWWEEPETQDPANPLYWSARRKWLNIGVISTISFIVPLVSSMLAPGVDLVMTEFRTTSETFATFVVSIFVLGFAWGSLILPPMSELYGRVVVYNVTNILFLAFTIMCAVARNPSMLLAARFLSGFVGVATITIGSGSIADLMPKEKRGKAVSIWSVGTILGPMVGPIFGGYVAQTYGWREVFWFISIPIAVVILAAFIVLRETYAPVLLERKAARLRKTTGNPKYISKLARQLGRRQTFKIALVRPVKLLVNYPIVTIMCSYGAFLYGTLYLLFSTYSFVFKETYMFTTETVGLVFIAGGIGTLAGLVWVGNFSDGSLEKRAAAGLKPTPEDRFPPLITIPGTLAFPLGLFIYGWTAEYKLQWLVPQIGTGITGFGSILVFVAIQTYLIDAFEMYAASVVGANVVLRGTAGALIPLAGLGLYDTLGLGWGNSVLGFVSLALAPLLMILAVHGAKLRTFTWFKMPL